MFKRIARKIYRECSKYVCKYDIYGEEHIKHFGKDFPDKTFYVIRRRPPGAGLLSNLHWILNHVIYANSKGYIPVVNMQDYKTAYHEKTLIELDNGKKIDPLGNAWEYFFEQPCGYSLKDIKNAKNVILGNWYIYDIAESPNIFGGSESISEYNKLISKYCKLNPEVTLASEKKRQLLFCDKKNILGVLHRGTDYRSALRTSSIPANLEQIIEKTSQVLQREKFDYIFLRTEEQEAVDEFYKIFSKEKVIVSEMDRIKNYENLEKGGEICNVSREIFPIYKNTLEYLTDIIVLSQCDGLIAAPTNGTHYALGLNNNKYRFSCVIDISKT